MSETPPPVSSDTPMDEFETINTRGRGHNSVPKIKLSTIKILTFLVIAVMIVIGVIAVAIVAVNRTQNTTTTIPTPGPIVATPFVTPTPQPVRDLPEDWQSLENAINTLQRTATQPSEDRSKLSIPTINFSTDLRE